MYILLLVLLTEKNLLLVLLTEKLATSIELPYLKYASIVTQVLVEQVGVFGCTATLNFFEEQNAIYPPTTNDDGMYTHLKKVTVDLLGDNHFAVTPQVMGAEDFAFYSEVIPAAFYFIGIRNEELGSVHIGHSPHFMIDEDSLPVGAAVHAAVAERYLNDKCS